MNNDTLLYSFILDLANGKEKSRVKVAKTLLVSTAEEREEAILQGTKAKDFRVRRMAFALIGEMQDKKLAGHIPKGLQDKHSDVIQMAIWAMGRLKWREGVPALSALLSKGFGFKITKTIVWAIGEIGDPSAVEQLNQLLQGASARLTEGILVSGMKLGHHTFIKLIQSLDCTQESVQAALKDASSASGDIRGAFIRAVVRTKENKVLASLLGALPYVTFYDADYKRLMDDSRENVRLSVCQSIANSLLPKNIKLSFLISLLRDPSNGVVKTALKHLSSYLKEDQVKKSIESLKANHPSPKIQYLAQTVIESDAQFQHIQELTPKWGRYILETLPGLESFVIEEATLQGITLQKGVVGDGWIEVIQDEADLMKLRLLHTIVQVHGVLSFTDEENDSISINPYVKDYNIDQLTSRFKKIKIKSTVFETALVVTEKEMTRPTRRLRSTSLDWRVARAMVLCSKPSDGDVFVDPTCGSGTLLLDRAAFGTYRTLKGGDLDAEAVQTAADNLSKYNDVDVQIWDATSLPLEDSSVSVIVSNLPFGRRVGDHEANVALYPPFMKEVNRVLDVGGRAVLLTQEVNLFHHAVALYKNNFTMEMDHPIEMGGLTPHIIVLKKK
ncbi:HEAT repeat domain-containing protein [Shimazuella alba]|uniref:Methyltransferase domain-containing protein n=1 Tax=Shimazuella alba TaxID=2690964 RepID=A0A6I4VY59_9BACL|nr:HEAT repeat domain-containing protein [Shimazuella alba]MXQ55681.1 methyltransferase domain-containing protein [Shimazuella alba]